MGLSASAGLATLRKAWGWGQSFPYANLGWYSVINIYVSCKALSCVSFPLFGDRRCECPNRQEPTRWGYQHYPVQSEITQLYWVYVLNVLNWLHVLKHDISRSTCFCGMNSDFAFWPTWSIGFLPSGQKQRKWMSEQQQQAPTSHEDCLCTCVLLRLLKQIHCKKKKTLISQRKSKRVVRNVEGTMKTIIKTQ